MSGQSGGIDNKSGTIRTGGGDVVGGNKNVTNNYFGSAAAARVPFRSTIPSLRYRLVGREDLLGDIAAVLDDPAKDRVVVLRGPAGVGKSELAREFARRHGQAYPGGRFFLIGEDQAIVLELSRLGQREFPDFPEKLALEDQAIWTLQALGNAGTLLIYDNVTSEEAVQRWLPAAGMPCHVIITTLLDRWDAGWKSLRVEKLSPEMSLELVAELTGDSLAAQYGRQLAGTADGLPVHLVSASAALAKQARRGHADAASFMALNAQTQGSFAGVYQLLSAPARLVVHAAARLNPQRIPRGELQRHLCDALGWSEGAFQCHLDACLDLFVLQGEAELRMHQLFARFVLEHGLADEIAASVLAVAKVQAARMVALAEEVADHPNRLELAALLLLFAPEAAHWRSGDDVVPVSAGKIVGQALLEIGQFAAAGPWFEREAQASEQDDIHGRVDHTSVGASLHQVGYCLSSQGQFAEAQPWFKRAAHAIEQGDIYGRVNYESLGRSLHQVGYCLVSEGEFAAAQPWFERAVETAQQGDIHGRINHATLGSSLHQVGYCLRRQGQFAAAQPWFARAVQAAEQGDIHHRVDHESIGDSLDQVGHCLSDQSRFAAAQPWSERAVKAKEKGDIHGRVDQESLGRSLHQVGYCLASEDEFAAAQPWFVRAVQAAEQGDIYGRVNYASLGVSLNLLGQCLLALDQFATAQPWFERAVEVTEKGDVHGRVDYESIGNSLHFVGYCLSSQREFAAALPWYKRAVAAAEKGDIHGCIDQESLGRSLHEVGYCLSSHGQFAAAGLWFERAVEAQEQGDIYGRVDYATLGISLREVGNCLVRQGQVAAAKLWFERADQAAAFVAGHGESVPETD